MTEQVSAIKTQRNQAVSLINVKFLRKEYSDRS
jgi:hypothetical protein